MLKGCLKIHLTMPTTIEFPPRGGIKGGVKGRTPSKHPPTPLKGGIFRQPLRAVFLMVVLMAFPAVSAIADNTSKENAAVVSAEKWLGLVDAENYAESWRESAEMFRNAVKQAQWEQSLQAVRKPLGKLLSRKVKAKTFSTALPGAPDGEYVVIQFETSFERKKSAIETVTPMLEKDGKWRVSGYYIK